jgi:hypothetical protein
VFENLRNLYETASRVRENKQHIANIPETVDMIAAVHKVFYQPVSELLEADESQINEVPIIKRALEALALTTDLEAASQDQRKTSN